MDAFECFIIKQLLDAWSYEVAQGRFVATMRPLSARIKQMIVSEGAKRQLSEREVESTLTRVQNNVPHWGESRWQSVMGNAICLTNEGEGTLYKISCDDLSLNASVEMEMLHTGRTTNGPQLLVLSCSRMSLQPGDVVTPYADAYLTCNRSLTLCVERNNKRWPDTQRVMHIDKITGLSRLEPSPLSQVIDSTRSFTYEEEQALTPSSLGSPAWSISPMTLLMHLHSHALPLYADFDNEGKTASVTKGSGDASSRPELTPLTQQKARWVEQHAKISFLPK